MAESCARAAAGRGVWTPFTPALHGVPSPPLQVPAWVTQARQGVIYHTLSQKEAKELDVQRPGAQRAEAFLQAFLRRCTPHMSQSAREDQLQRKAVVLEYFTRRRGKEQRRRARGLSARQRRALRLFDIKPEQQRYDLFLPLHELWKQYIRDLCNGLRPDTQPQAIQAKLLKADLHGAIVSVIPKLGCVFSVETDGFVSYIHGSKFQLRSSERSAKKFKAKGTMDL
ncbi:PREDICTED: ribonuclease P protein subunit p29 [Myotis brandtii]|uniref:ribonuclease P protein subunit p29 n=1 Tax=Myotis brandtii TaxID=109478 RepID=UPI0007041153|nr:PREDICTED: ribonuclease P protein subunit p29 [Myotis brandtii]